VPEPRKHHSVPQFVLRSFSAGGQGRQVYAFDKSQGVSRLIAVRDAGSERDFYRASIRGGIVNFEPAFQEIDDLGADVWEILTAATLSQLDDATISRLPALATAQLLRTKLQRTTPQDLTLQLRRRAEEAGLDVPPEITDEDARRIALNMLINGDGVQAAFESKDMFIVQAQGNNRFWTSDNPVVMHNSFPYGNIGIDAVGVEIYLSVSPLRALAFFCPSIGKQVAESLDTKHPRPALQKPMFPRLLRAIQTKGTVEVDDDYVNLVNELQMQQSSRFLFSATDNFDTARTMIESRPELANIASLFRIGGLGEAPPPRTAMPAGEWLVVESGSNHHAIPVTSINNVPRAGIVFEPLDYTKVGIAAQDAPFDVAILYRDGSEVRGMRDVTFEYLRLEQRRIIHVRPVDEGINRLLERLSSSGLGNVED